MHIDVWWPAQVKYIGGTHYYVTFIDDANRKTWVYCIRQKSYVFATFKKWKDLVESETGKRLKCLKSDNVGEYYIKYFDIYYPYHGIHRENTVLGTPQKIACHKGWKGWSRSVQSVWYCIQGFPYSFGLML